MNGPPTEQIKAIVEGVTVQDAGLPWMLMALILVGAAVISWSIAKALEATAKKKYRADHPGVTAREADRQLWWTPMLAVGNILFGFALGAVVGGYQWEWLYGAVVGGIGGGSPFIVPLFKSVVTAFGKKAGGGGKDGPAP